MKAVALSARRALVLGRLVRLVIKRRLEGHRVEDLLNVVDRRTLAKLLMLGGVRSGRPADLPPTVGDLLSQQQLIMNSAAILELRREVESKFNLE